MVVTGFACAFAAGCAAAGAAPAPPTPAATGATGAAAAGATAGAAAATCRRSRWLRKGVGVGEGVEEEGAGSTRTASRFRGMG